MKYSVALFKISKRRGRMEARIKSRSGSCGFDPPDSFPGDVIRYHGVPPEHPSHAVPPEGPLFHATMDGELLQSYLTWRAEVSEHGEAAPH